MALARTETVSEAIPDPDPDALDPEALDPDALDREALDREALERTAAGEVDAFRRLVEGHQDRLMRLCQGLLGDPEEARDAVQEVFLKAYRKAGSYRPRGRVYTWLYRIAVNHCLNRLRRRKVVRFLSLTGAGGGGSEERSALDPADSGPGPAERLDARQRWARTREALESLPEGQRAAVVLAKLEGLSQREVAGVLGISEGAVEGRLFRAMRKLESALAATLENAPTQENGTEGVS